VFFLNVENKCDKTAKAIHWVGARDGGWEGASQEEKCPDGNFYFTLRMSEPGDQREGEEQEEDYFERRCIATIRSLSVDDIMMLTNWLLAELRRRSEGGDREGGILNPE
jgi:hypothetical protein